jgi:glyoxylase-like metal-dependent hydrolase (beta-lactamase superfamily II)
MLLSGHHALIIDPCINASAMLLLKDHGVNEALVLPTHEHYDHISGVNWIKENLNSKVIASEQCYRHEFLF